jgi:hypothetical protein
MYAMHTPFDLCAYVIDVALAARSYSAAARASRGLEMQKETRQMDQSELFADVPVTGVPAVRDEYLNKMPGAADSNGDHCAS